MLNKKIIGEIFSWSKALLFALSISIIVSAFILQPFIVSGSSMEPTLDGEDPFNKVKIGDRVLIYKSGYILGEEPKYNDIDTVKVIDNQLITYDKVRDVQIKSEQEAYNEISDGKFRNYSQNKVIETLHIHKVEVSYLLDSKGYYQPVYVFHSTVDGMEMTILIPGI